MSARLSTHAGPEFERCAEYDGFFNSDENKKLKQLRARETMPICSPISSCDTNLFFGFFFDGTGNNYIAADKTNNHSNIARLYDCFPGMSVPGVLPKSAEWEHKSAEHKHFFRVYVPGVGTEFPQAKDSGAGTDQVMGGGTGCWGERRIIWALAQAINNVHRFFVGSALISPAELSNLFANLALTKGTRSVVDGRYGPDTGMTDSATGTQTKYILSRMLSRLHQAVSLHWRDKRTGKPAKKEPGTVKTIYISIFGFSRGATQARAFANWLHTLCRLDAQLCGAKRMSLGGFPVEFDFLGIFDTVASVGMGNGVAAMNGHGAWADAEDSLRVPTGMKCLHLVAAHELRRSFPLITMYKEARLNGVPLKLELATEATKAKFAVSKATIQAFNAYLDTCKEKQGPLNRIVREHMRKQIEWRVHRRVSGRTPLHKSGSFLQASPFHQNELHSAALEFDEEIQTFMAWLQSMGTHFKPSPQGPGFGNMHHAEWEEIATFWPTLAQPCPATLDLFDNYVHDSRASFRLSGPLSEGEMHEYLKRRVRQREQAMAVAGRTGEYRLMLTPDEDRAAAEYARTKTIPRFRVGGREPWDRSYGVISKAGYLRYRKIYAGSDTSLIS